MVLEKIKKMIVNELEIPEEKVTLDARLSEDLGIDSIDAVEIVMYVEEEFEIQVDDDAAMDLKTVEDLVNYVQKLIDEK